ncbi:MAG TPA: formate dehydrogenase accessory protein FdhE, partial [Terriglobales bacterium]|nr:formate dehydrogenase accessory protein FdhE [Terriglobales bacterium]
RIAEMPRSLAQKRIARAEELAKAHVSVGEILKFYAEVARLQGEMRARFASRPWPLPGSGALDVLALGAIFPKFIDQLAKKATPQLKQAATELKNAGQEKWSALLCEEWQGSGQQFDLQIAFVCRAFLQPVAELAREQVQLSLKDYFERICPFCARRPGVAVLRPEGDGAKRSLQCSFCLGEWNFRRIVCPSCGEEDNQKLPVYTAEEFDYIRVEACDTCKTYIKSVDLTKNGHAEPVVDEIASAALDVWAREHGYEKIELNLMGM